MTADALADRARERERLLELARGYVERLAERRLLVAAAVVGSVARGDFNVWSDVDVVIVADELPVRAPDRSWLLAKDAPPGVQAAGYTRDEFDEALRRANPLATEAVENGVVLLGAEFLRRRRLRPRSRGASAGRAAPSRRARS